VSIRCTLLSNAPWTGTGYGSQTRLFIPRFKAAGHEPAVIAFYGLEGGVQNWNGINIYPRYRDVYGSDIAALHTIHHQADVMLSLMDAWIMQPALLSRIKWAPWYPVDADPLPEPIKKVVAHAYERITMSRFGERMTQEAGLDSTYIPHGFDPAIFKPLDKAECRERLGLPQDRFIALMVAANKGVPSRKCFPQQFEAFGMLAAKHDDALLYVHSEAAGSNGYNLVEMAQRYGIADKTILADSYEYLLGYPDEYVATLYNAADVLLHVSMGEGFGIPIIEAQACGTPVILGDWTAMPELLRGGWAIDKSEAEKFLMPIGSFQWLPHPAAIAERLEDAYIYKSTDAGLDMSLKAQAVAADYAVDVVMERHWNPWFERLERRLTEEKRLLAAKPVNGATPRMAGVRVSH
jgi:glycosyltransferase involved in cell wall biosynthesis